jgi:hypothetical protein
MTGMSAKSLLLAVKSDLDGEFQAFRVDESGMSDRGVSTPERLLCLLAVEQFDAIAVSSPPDLDAIKLLRILSGRLPLLALLNPGNAEVDPFKVYEAALTLMPVESGGD